eukprot:TRINITY_DN1172_c2_g1_i1.p1 TRINITY_DN1172_c2_g1~~TRINITY_DN1172_c2_g1_i1.p1  ORF type:complete len:491 (-),score=246.68 TRINITY_DN1172_c2_g1_i1:23-1411(-)
MLSQTDVLNKILLGSLAKMLEEVSAQESSEEEDGFEDDEDQIYNNTSSSSSSSNTNKGGAYPFPNEAIRVAVTKKVPEKADDSPHIMHWMDNQIDDDEVPWNEAELDLAQISSQTKDLFSFSSSSRSSSSSAPPRLGLHVLGPRLYWQPVDSSDLSILIEVDDDEYEEEEEEEKVEVSSSSVVSKGKKTKGRKKRGDDEEDEEEEDDPVVPSSEEFGFSMSSDIWAFTPPPLEDLDSKKKKKKKRTSDEPPVTHVPEALKVVHELMGREGVCEKTAYYRPDTIEQTDQLMDQLLSLAGGSKLWILIDRDFVDEQALDQDKNFDVLKSLSEQQRPKAVFGLLIIRERYLQNSPVKALELVFDRKHREARSMAEEVLKTATQISLDREIYSARRVEVLLMEDDETLLSLVRSFGFVQEAVLRQLFSKHGSVSDGLLFSLLPDDFTALLSAGSSPLVSRSFSIVP